MFSRLKRCRIHYVVLIKKYAKNFIVDVVAVVVFMSLFLLLSYIVVIEYVIAADVVIRVVVSVELSLL